MPHSISRLAQRSDLSHRWLPKLDRSKESLNELASARVSLARTALASVAETRGPEAENLRYRLALKLERCIDPTQCAPLNRLSDIGLMAIRVEREKLESLREQDRIGPDAYLGLQEQLDWNELTLLRDGDRQIEEI